MTGAAPLRLFVAGNSCSYMVVPPGGPAYPRLVAAELGAHLSGHTRWMGTLTRLRPDWERVRDAWPDVLVLNYGLLECQPAVLPFEVVRHFQTWDRTARPLALAYRRRVAPRMWRVSRDVQRRASDRTTRWRVPPSRLSAELADVIRMARAELQCLVLVLDVDPPGERLRHWLPGIEARIAECNALLRRVVEQADDPQVRFVPASETVTADLLPDGMHRAPEGHRRTADLILEEVAR